MEAQQADARGAGDETMFYSTGNKWTKGDGIEIDPSPVQSSKNVPRVVAEEAYKEYAELYGRSQSLERLEERGGFGSSELAILLFQRIKRLEAELKSK